MTDIDRAIADGLPFPIYIHSYLSFSFSLFTSEIEEYLQTFT